MATPALTPDSQTSTTVLPSTGSYTEAAKTAHYPHAIYADTSSDLYDASFVTGAVEQVTYVFRKLGGDVLDLEITDKNVYAAYEEAVLEYSYIVNVHQSKNVLHSSLGATTGTFDSDGQRTDSSSGSNVELRYPKFQFTYPKRVMENSIEEVGLGGTTAVYSASFNLTQDIQDYDLQNIISSSADDSTLPFYNKVGNNRVIIRKVFYKTPHAMWRFYGYYGGMNSVGNLSTYGMFSDDSTFEVIPPWHNKLQAMAYEDAIYTRNSHYSYEIKNNVLRVWPTPSSVTPSKMWVQFTVTSDPWDDQEDRADGVEGVNNMNTLPLTNLPYTNINSIGKQWIRRFSLSLVKETLGQIRSKFGAIPIPGQTVNLNGGDLISQAREEQKTLREELQKVLDELTYQKMAEIQSDISKNTAEIVRTYPYFIYTG
jgi:hypothetical protein